MSDVTTEITEPAGVRRLPKNKAGYRVPWFAARTGDNEWDFRVIRPGGTLTAFRQRLCWICGLNLGAYKTFVIGPMCVINRVSSEPPMHLDCAEYSVRVCPFLTRPSMRRRTTALDDVLQPAGVMVLRNPGVTAVWTTRRFTGQPEPDGGALFDIGSPIEVSWWAEGRRATREEVDASIEVGFPQLLEAAQRDGARGVAALAEMTEAAMKFLPASA